MFKFLSSKTMDTKVIFSKKPPRERNGYQDDFGGDHAYDGEYSDDDDVFVEDPILDVSMATKPLMHPRQRARVKSRRPDCKCHLLFRPILYFLFLVVSLGGLMLLILFLVNKYQHRHDFVKQKLIGGKGVVSMPVIGCDDIEVEDVWVVGIPKLLTESAFRMVEVNQDGVLDVIFGFATGADGYGVPDILCDIYFNGTFPCFGGLLALDGRTGKELWRHYAHHELYGINCEADLNGDGVMDCLAGGRAGTFQAVSGKDGKLLWDFGEQESRNSIMNLYTAQLVSDLDHDGVVDVLSAHGGDPLQEPGSNYRLTGRLIFFSGRTGEVLRWVGVPDQKETYYSPQIYSQLDGTQIVLFGTGGETHSGSLWRITLDHLYKGQIDQAVKIYTDDFKGVMTPPVLADINGDGVEDIIISMFNSTTIAFDGHDYHQLWNATFPQSESYNTPAAGYFNNDDVLDFMLKFSHGPGFPVYYHSETTIVDGKNGRPLLKTPVRDTVGSQSSPLTINLEGRGNDVFLYWIADCQEHEGEGGAFSFVKGTNVHEQSRSDFCRLRFKTKGFSKVFALNSRIAAPGKTVYDSDDRTKVEHSSWVNTTQQSIDYIKAHPNVERIYSKLTSKVLGTEQPAQNFNTDILQPEHSNEFISPNANYRNEHTSSRKKGPPMSARQPTGRDRFPNVGNRGHDQFQYGNRNMNGNGNGNEGRYRGRDGGYMSTGSQPPGSPYDNGPYQLPYGYNPDSPYGGYYGRNDVDYDDNDDKYYQDYTRHRTSTKRSEPEKDFHFMRHKRDVKDENSFINFEKWKVLGEKLRGENDRREKGYGRFDGLYMKRKKRYSSNSQIHEKSDAQKRKRKRRHVGPHDDDGLQRLISTGTVAPSTLSPDHPDYNHTMDFIFATYWFYPAKTQAILPQDEKCIALKMKNEKQRFDQNNMYYGLDHDNYQRVITDDCLKESKHQLSDDGVYESQSQYNPFNVHMGQMTVYRIRIKCTCSNATLTDLVNKNKRCAQMLPFDQQKWPSYMGKHADSHWR